MDIKTAIVSAKNYVSELFSDEGIVNIGLEEIRLDDENQNWLITVGFSRVPKPQAAQNRVLEGLVGANPNLPRTYKVVRLRKDDGNLVSITSRAVEN